MYVWVATENLTTLRLLFLAATNVRDFSEVLTKISCVPECVILSDKYSIKIHKIAKISCR